MTPNVLLQVFEGAEGAYATGSESGEVARMCQVWVPIASPAIATVVFGVVQIRVSAPLMISYTT